MYYQEFKMFGASKPVLLNPYFNSILSCAYPHGRGLDNNMKLTILSSTKLLYVYFSSLHPVLFLNHSTRTYYLLVFRV